MFYKSISVNHFRRTKASYKEVLAPNRVLNEHQVNSPSGEDIQVLHGMKMRLAFSHLCWNYSFHFFLVVPEQQGGSAKPLQFEAPKHSLNPKMSMWWWLPFCKYRNASTGTRMYGDALILHRHQMKWVDFVQTKRLPLEQQSGLFPHLFPNSKLPS